MTEELISQYKAAVHMLENSINNCPESLWNDDSYKNIYWQIVYHTLHYTNFYLAKSQDSFVPWGKHIENWHRFENINFDRKRGATAFQYSKSELLDYVYELIGAVENQITEKSLYEQTGFEWLKMNRLELHLYNLRHLQHHTGQLTERLQQCNAGKSDWIDAG
jgi:uncharacterized damage-inducible protein DinB